MEIIEEYKEYLKIKGRTEAGIKTYLKRVKGFLKKAGKKIKEITKEDVKIVIMSDIKKGRSPKTINTNIHAIDSFFNWLVLEGKILINPVSKIEKQKEGKRKIQNVRSELEMRKILEAVEGVKERAVLELMYSTGIRLNEIYSLNLEDVNLKEQYVIVKKGKGKKERVVPIGNTARGAIEDYLKIRKQTYGVKALFTSKTAVAVTRLGEIRIRNIVKEAGYKAGVRVTPHIIRRSFATHIARAGCGMVYISKMLGHSNFKTLELYVDIAEKDMQKEHKKIHPRG